MIKAKYQLFFLLATGLSGVIIGTKVYGQGMQEQLKSYDFGRASAGFDFDSSGQNPDSDTSNPAVYSGTEKNHPSVPMAANHYPSAPYTANVPGIPVGPGNGLPAASIIPDQNAQNYYSANQQFMQPKSLPNTSIRNLTAINPKLKVDKTTGLPPTVLDSFVAESGYSDSTYGDEGGLFPPGAGSFTTISTGFRGQTKKGLTTGHGSRLPSAWSDGSSVSGPDYASNPLNPLNLLPANILTH